MPHRWTTRTPLRSRHTPTCVAVRGFLEGSWIYPAPSRVTGVHHIRSTIFDKENLECRNVICNRFAALAVAFFRNWLLLDKVKRWSAKPRPFVPITRRIFTMVVKAVIKAA